MPTNVCTVYLPASPRLARLIEVANDMRRLGSPTIRMYDSGKYFIAIEGSHRVAAAAILGVPVIVQRLEPDDVIDLDTVDLDFGPDDFVGGTCLVRVKDLIDWFCSWRHQPNVLVTVEYSI